MGLNHIGLCPFLLQCHSNDTWTVEVYSRDRMLRNYSPVIWWRRWRFRIVTSRSFWNPPLAQLHPPPAPAPPSLSLDSFDDSRVIWRTRETSMIMASNMRFVVRSGDCFDVWSPTIWKSLWKCDAGLTVLRCRLFSKNDLIFTLYKSCDQHYCHSYAV